MSSVLFSVQLEQLEIQLEIQFGSVGAVGAVGEFKSSWGSSERVQLGGVQFGQKRVVGIQFV